MAVFAQVLLYAYWALVVSFSLHMMLWARNRFRVHVAYAISGMAFVARVQFARQPSSVAFSICATVVVIMILAAAWQYIIRQGPRRPHGDSLNGNGSS